MSVSELLLISLWKVQNIKVFILKDICIALWNICLYTQNIGLQYDKDPVLWFRTVKLRFIILIVLHPVDYTRFYFSSEKVLVL